MYLSHMNTCGQVTLIQSMSYKINARSYECWLRFSFGQSSAWCSLDNYCMVIVAIHLAIDPIYTPRQWLVCERLCIIFIDTPYSMSSTVVREIWPPEPRQPQVELKVNKKDMLKPQPQLRAGVEIFSLFFESLLQALVLYRHSCTQDCLDSTYACNSPRPTASTQVSIVTDCSCIWQQLVGQLVGLHVWCWSQKQSDVFWQWRTRGIWVRLFNN